MPRLSSTSWLNGLAALIGGLMLGFGLGRFVHQPSLHFGALALVGLLVLWYAVSDYRKARPDTPESETHGHTVE
ncbi:MAG: hypothetical protein ACJ8J0_02550 [Longimicrobiaceae bacterium]